MREKIKHKIINGIEHKQCGKCKQWKDLNCFSVANNSWDKLACWCKSCMTQYYQDNKEKINKQNNKNRQLNKGRTKILNKLYKLTNKEKIKKDNRQYKQNNKGKINANRAKRRTMEKNQTPFDADIKKIQQLYDICSETNEILGEIYFHTDHIQPTSKGGLHHQDNLQILEAYLNMSKHDKYPLTKKEKVKYKGIKI